MNRLSADSAIDELVRQNESLLPFLYLTGVRTVSPGQTIRDCCREKGLNEDFLIQLMAVCLNDPAVKTDALSSYSMIQLTGLCRQIYPYFLKRLDDLMPLLLQFETRFLPVSDLDRDGERLARPLAAYRQLLADCFQRLDKKVLPHASLVYELYYSPAFTAERPDLLDYSLEFFKSRRQEMMTWFESSAGYLKPALETGKPGLPEVQPVFDFYSLHKQWLMQDQLEQQLLRKLVLKMEDGIILTVQKQKKPFFRSNYVPIEQEDEVTGPVQLTEREKEVLTYVALGYLNKEIAAQLNIGLTTVITHRKKLVEKLGIKTVSGLTVYAHTHGYID